MDAKTIRGLVGLAALSLFCATVAWAADHAVFTSVFAALGVAAVLGAQPREAEAYMDSEERKDTVLLVALAVVGVILMLVLLGLAVGPLMMR